MNLLIYFHEDFINTNARIVFDMFLLHGTDDDNFYDICSNTHTICIYIYINMCLLSNLVFMFFWDATKNAFQKLFYVFMCSLLIAFYSVFQCFLTVFSITCSAFDCFYATIFTTALMVSFSFIKHRHAVLVVGF